MKLVGETVAWTLGLLGAGVLLGGCTTGSSSGPTSCEPGESTFCRCDNGEAGVQECQADGETYGACGPCDPLPFPITTGGGGGAGGDNNPSTVDVLLIPDSTDDAIGLYDPEDGSYLGDWLPPNQPTDAHTFSTPINAVQGLNDHIFVSDQIEDAVLEFMPDGTFVGVFADATDGLDNIRGIDFFGTDLFVSDTSGVIARFAATGDRLPDLISDMTLDPFDILLEPSGNTLVVDIASPSRVRFYPAGSTTTFSHLVQRDFPQQLKPNPGGGYLVAAFTSGEVLEVDELGVVGRTVALPNARGVHPLGNGNWLVTASTGGGVRVVDPDDGSTVAQVRDGSGFRFIEQATLPAR